MKCAGRLAAACLVLVALAGCGDDDADTSGSASSSVPATTTSAPAAPATTSGTAGGVEILATANLQFVPNELSAKTGELFQGTLEQRGAIPHNIEFKDFGVKGADTMTGKAGDRKSFSFTPSKPGSFTYVCTIHPATMTGTLTVS